MNKIEILKKEISKLNKELKEHQSKCKQIQNRIRQKNYFINTLNIPKIKVKPTTILDRDVNICLDFIKQNSGCTSRQICDHLNKELRIEFKRWKSELYTNKFMSMMGQYIEKNNEIISELSVAGTPTRRTKIWKIK